MDANLFAVALAEEEDLISQRDAIDARLAAIRRIKVAYEENKQKKRVIDRLLPLPNARSPAIKAAVKDFMSEALGPVLTRDLLSYLCDRGLVDAANEADKAYARATLRRMKDCILRTDTGWVLKK